MGVHTNGMGHVIQAVRLIGALAKAGIEVDTVCFGDMSKVPQNFLDDFKRLMPGVHLLSPPPDPNPNPNPNPNPDPNPNSNPNQGGARPLG